MALQLTLYQWDAIRELDRKRIDKLATLLDFSFDWKQDEPGLRSQAGALIDRYAQRATLFILDKARAFARENGKKLLVVLNDTHRALPELIANDRRHDQEVVNYLKREHFDYFDMNEVHLREQRKSGLSYKEYIKPYLVGGKGHYSPQGNHFFAYAIKDKIVPWLEPVPITYQKRGSGNVDFEDYLFNGGLSGK